MLTQPARSTAIIRCRPTDSLGPRSRPILQRTLSPASNSRATSLKSHGPWVNGRQSGLGFYPDGTSMAAPHAAGVAALVKQMPRV